MTALSSGPRFDGRTVIITGAAGLIGSALAEGFAAAGARLALVDVDGAGLDQRAAAIAAAGPDRPLCVRADLTEPGAAAEIVSSTVDHFGEIDVLVNNAGGNHRVLPHEIDEPHWDRLSDLNLKACFFLSQAFGRRLIESGRGGSIVNVSSTCGCSGMGRGNLVFSVAKAGVNHLTRELALEWGANGIRVNAVAPSQVDSPAMREWMAQVGPDGRPVGATFLGGVPLGRLVTAQDIVGPVLFLASDAAAMVTGVVLPVDGGNLTANIAGTVGARIEAE